MILRLQRQWMTGKLYSSRKLTTVLQNVFSLSYNSQKMSRTFHKWPSYRVRKEFVNFFVEKNHQYIRSSPVIPWNDPTLAFVNAGMNQFKPILLGEKRTLYPCAVNSQKCIRVGGKHNDLADVGQDTYHHTFFEMLGNWSFGNYFKQEACQMAWLLLTEVYQIPPDHLYITYFGGDAKLELEPDLETRDIWLSIGVPSSRVLPFGTTDNFWEMGQVGPCGPCTEIHYDRARRSDAGNRVNLGVEDMIELWNLVFIQYERKADGCLRKLETHHVDTGMGLERITAVLNGKSSNYDTDLFIPLFNEIEKISKCQAYSGAFSPDGTCLDTAYRILADHTRMLTVALSDGMFPDDSHKLRRIIRRAQTLGWEDFGLKHEKNFLQHLVHVVASILGEAYPEITKNLSNTITILEKEEEIFKEMKGQISCEWKALIRSNPELDVLSDHRTPGLIEAIKELHIAMADIRHYENTLPADFIFKLYDTYGLHLDLIEDLTTLYNLNMDVIGFQRKLEETRLLTKQVLQEKLSLSMDCNISKNIMEELNRVGTPATNSDAKYNYVSTNNGNYSFPPLESEILALISNDTLVKEASDGMWVGVVLNKTNFYHEAGGQEGDRGVLTLEDSHIPINYVDFKEDFVFHWGYVKGDKKVMVGDKVEAVVNAGRRFGCMQHHTATHLLNTAVKAVAGPSSQRSSHVAEDHLRLDVLSYKPLDATQTCSLENAVQGWIVNGSDIERQQLDLDEALLIPDLSLLPGEVYPSQVYLLRTKLPDLGMDSVELCCGTHLHNTSHIGHFVITQSKASGVGVRSLRAVCGDSAKAIEEGGKLVLDELMEWQENIHTTLQNSDEERLSTLQDELSQWILHNKEKVLPYRVQHKINQEVDIMQRQIRNIKRKDANDQMVKEMESVLKNHKNGPVVHIINTHFGSNKAVLSKATRITAAHPTLVLAFAEGIVVGRCTVPQESANNNLSAVEWMVCVQKILGGKASAPRGQNPLHVYNLRAKRMPLDEAQSKVQKAILAAEQYANNF
ncbi:alanine--tRNA ligase, mitochondrial isoform X2 [Oratosquilla oratoria]